MREGANVLRVRQREKGVRLAVSVSSCMTICCFVLSVENVSQHILLQVCVCLDQWEKKHVIRSMCVFDELFDAGCVCQSDVSE